MVVGKELRKIREAKSLSQGEVQRRSGLSRSYLSRVEGGHTAPSLAIVKKLANALEIEPDRLLCEKRNAPKRYGRTVITTAFPSTSEIAKAFGLSKKRVDRISRLVESVRRANGKIHRSVHVAT